MSRALQVIRDEGPRAQRSSQDRLGSSQATSTIARRSSWRLTCGTTGCALSPTRPMICSRQPRSRCWAYHPVPKAVGSPKNDTPDIVDPISGV